MVASDSRLRFGCAWDCCPKIVPLPRGDCVLAFCGNTHYAYPLMLQIANAMSLHPGSRDRSQDIFKAKGHLIRIFAEMRTHIRDFPEGATEAEEPDTSFLLAGFSWRFSSFVIWNIHFDRGLKNFTWKRARPWSGVEGDVTCLILGNPSMGPNVRKRLGNAAALSPALDVEEMARRRLVEKLRRRVKPTGGRALCLDMEPFEVLRDMIRESVSNHVGGPPQLVKIYRHMNARPIAVRWPDRASGKATLLGRSILDYETLDCPVLDPDTLEVTPP